MLEKELIGDIQLRGKADYIGDLLRGYREGFRGKSSQEVRDLLAIRQVQYSHFYENAVQMHKKYNLLVGYMWTSFAGVAGMFGLNALTEGLTATSSLALGAIGVAILAGAEYFNEKKIQILEEDYARNLDKVVLINLAESKEKQEAERRALECAILESQQREEFEQAVAEDGRNSVQNDTNCVDTCENEAEYEENSEPCASDWISLGGCCADCPKYCESLKIIREQDFFVEGVIPANVFVVTADARKDMEEFLFGEKPSDSMQR